MPTTGTKHALHPASFNVALNIEMLLSSGRGCCPLLSCLQPTRWVYEVAWMSCSASMILELLVGWQHLVLVSSISLAPIYAGQQLD